MHRLYLCVVFILGTIHASLIVPSHNEPVRTRFIASTSQINMPTLLHVGEGRAEARPYRGSGDTSLIYIHATTQTITAYDPQTDTHTPIFTCPEACYDPSTDENGRIAFVTASGFGIFDTILGDYTQFSVDFGVYGYKGGATFRSDLAYVVYEGRFDMQMRLLLTDLSSGETTDLGSSGVGNPAWSWDEQAVLVSDGYDLFIVPIDGGDVERVEMSRYQDPFYVDGMDLFSAHSEDSWFFRGVNNGTMGLYLGTVKDYEQVSGDDVHSALITYSVTDTLTGTIFFSARAGDYTISVVDISSVPVRTRFCTSTFTSSDSCFLVSTQYEMIDIALAPDSQYVAWIEENPDMGFGFYDLWVADLSAPNITPTRIAEQISNPSTRPSALTWMRNG